MKAKALTELESWRPLECFANNSKWVVHQEGPWVCKVLRRKDVKPRVFKTRAAALRAANKQNDLDGLPRVA